VGRCAAECLPVGVADDEAGVGFLDGPGRREAALGHGPLEHARHHATRRTDERGEGYRLPFGFYAHHGHGLLFAIASRTLPK
jgi:hypothetical protein